MDPHTRTRIRNRLADLPPEALAVERTQLARAARLAEAEVARSAEVLALCDEILSWRRQRVTEGR